MAHAYIDHDTNTIVLPSGRSIPWTVATAACHNLPLPGWEVSAAGNKTIRNTPLVFPGKATGASDGR